MITQTFVYECDACGKREESEPMKLYRGDAPMRPDTPLLWLFVDGRLYCHDHKIEVRIDGETPK